MREGGLNPMSQASFHSTWGYLGPFRVSTRLPSRQVPATSPWGPLGPGLAANRDGEGSIAHPGRGIVSCMSNGIRDNSDDSRMRY